MAVPAGRACFHLEVQNSNQVVYENAFNENGVRADVIFTIEKGSFRQDVVFRSRLNVANYGFPTNTTRIQIFTEFYDAPQPDRIVRPIRVEADQKVRLRMASPDLIDEILGWGELAFATGRARMADAEVASGAACAPIVKTFTNILSRAFMIESVEFSAIRNELASLPDTLGKGASAQPRRVKNSDGYAEIPSPHSAEQASAAQSRRTMRMASAGDFGKRPGVALDYLAELTVPITQAKVFQGDTTYVVAGEITCSSTVTIEGGGCSSTRHRARPPTSN